MTSESTAEQAGLGRAENSCGCGGACEACRAKANSGGAWVYAIGSVTPRFPNLSVEKEVDQVVGRGDAAGLSDHQAFHAALSKSENRYLLRQLCWVFCVEGVETYLLSPRDPGDYALLLEAVRANPSRSDLDVVIGVRGPAKLAEFCAGLRLPVVAFDQLYSFDRTALLHSITPPESTPIETFGHMAEELLDRILRMADNAGSTDEHRTLNYLAVRYPAIYVKVAQEFSNNASLSSVSVRPSELGGNRRITQAIFAFTNRSTDVVEKFCARVDVTEEFPFLASKLAPYFDC
jgi:hypothetical protein